MHIYGAAVNQVADVEIDKVRVLLLIRYFDANPISNIMKKLEN